MKKQESPGVLVTAIIAGTLSGGMAVAGVRDGGGLPTHLPAPEAFKYECSALLQINSAGGQPGQNPASRQTFVIDSNNRETWNGGAGIILPKDKWENGTLTYGRQVVFTPSDSVPDYNLEGHFYSLSFSKQDDQWNATLRANIIFKQDEKTVDGTAAFATTDFTSRTIGARVLSRAYDLSIVCKRTQ